MVRTYGVSRKNPTGISDILTRMKNPQTRKSKQQSLKKEGRDPLLSYYTYSYFGASMFEEGRQRSLCWLYSYFVTRLKLYISVLASYDVSAGQARTLAFKLLIIGLWLVCYHCTEPLSEVFALPCSVNRIATFFSTGSIIIIYMRNCGTGM